MTILSNTTKWKTTNLVTMNLTKMTLMTMTWTKMTFLTAKQTTNWKKKMKLPNQWTMEQITLLNHL